MWGQDHEPFSIDWSLRLGALSMQRIFTALLVFAFFSLVAEPSNAQSRKNGRRTGSLIAFDPSVARLPSNFRGTDVPELYRRLVKATVPKGEFETESEYQARAKAGAERQGVGPTLYAIVTAVPTQGFAYDADKGAYTLLLGDRFGGLTWDGSSPVAATDIDLGGPRRRTRYRGSNALGATRTIERVTGFDHKLVLHQKSCDLFFTVERDLARRSKPHLAMLYVVSVGSAYASVATSSPTFDHPVDIELVSYCVAAQLHEVWLIDRTSGLVLGKKPICPGSNSAFVDSENAARARQAKQQMGELDALFRNEGVEGGALAGKALRRSHPFYPQMARAAGIQGVVVVEVSTDEQGHVTEARAISGHSLLVDTAVSAARQWLFAPTVVSGAPVRVVGTISFSFRLNK